MFPRRSVIVSRAAAGGFGLVVGLSLLSGAGEWTAAFRGLIAALICTLISSWLYGLVAEAVAQAANAPAAPQPAAAPRKAGNAP